MHNDKITQHLIDGLTPGQLAGLAARLLDGMSEADRTEFCGTLEPDVAVVLRRLWDPGPQPGAAAAKDAGGATRTSDAKFEDRFHSVLGDWQGLLMELGDEEGEYIVQEHHWEPPDFNAFQLKDDMERCAGDLLSLLERAAALDLEDEDLFVDLCEDITDGLVQYPEHIYTGDGVEFGPKATACMLTWIDLHARTEAAFLDVLLATIERSGSVSFEDGAFRTYLLDGWPLQRRRALYHAIEERRISDAEFRQQTNVPRTLWHGIRYSLASTFDAAAGVAIAEASVSGDWTKGVELVEAALAEGNPDRALEFCRKTVDAFYRSQSYGRESAGFEPGTTPLLGYRGAHNELPQLSRTLGIWADLAAKAGDQRLAGLLRVQQALFTHPDDWTAVRAAFAQAGTADRSALFCAWKKQALRQQDGSASGFGVSQAHPVWLEWLIDAGFAERFDAFTGKALAWLGEKPALPGKPGIDVFRPVPNHIRLPQMTLVAELLALESPAENYPNLRAMLAEHCRLRPCQARTEWLRRADTTKLGTAGVEFVRRNMAGLIPSPDTMGSDYTAAAGWLAVARELSPDLARNTLQRWQVEHKRRRNLWRDLRERGFDCQATR